MDWIMMVEKYHCDPLTFYKQPQNLLQLHREFMAIENKQRNLDAKRREQKLNIRQK